MPSPAEQSIPALTVTPRFWWHVLYATNGSGLTLRAVFGPDSRPPEEVCALEGDPIPDLGLPSCRYVASFDHEPTDEELAPWSADEESDNDQ